MQTIPRTENEIKYDFHREYVWTGDSFMGILTRDPSGNKIDMKFDKRMSNAYEENLNNRQQVSFPFLDDEFSLFNDKDKVMMSYNEQLYEIGLTNYRSRFIMDFKFTNFPLKEAFSYVTSCTTPETSCSSPSVIIHQIISFLLLRSIRKPGKMSFENESYKYKPDLMYSSRAGYYFIDITTKYGAEEKMKQYQQIIAIDKYKLYDLLILPKCVENDYFYFLKELSLNNDQVHFPLIKEILTSQNVTKIDTLFDEKVFHYFSTRSEKDIIAHSEMVKNVIQGYVKTKEEDTVELNIDNRIFPFSNDNNSSFSWLSFNLKRNRPQEDYISEGFLTIDDDELRLNTENTQPRVSKFFKRNNESIFMDSRSYNILTTYRRSKINQQADIEIHYNDACKHLFTERSHDYLTQKFTSAVRTNKMKELVVKEDKNIRNLNKIIPKQCHKSISPDSLSLVENKLFNDEECKIDPLHEDMIISVLEEDQAKSLLNMLRRSKIYDILILYMKVAQSLLYGVADGSCLIVPHPYKNIEAHVYVSGSVTEIDKGVAYVSLISNGELYRTSLWRPTDLKNYKVAVNRFLSCLMGAWPNVSGVYKFRLFNTYSLIILENSWGLSRVLKPFRYYVYSHMSQSPSKDLSKVKVLRSITDYREMSDNKMSLRYLGMLNNLKDFESSNVATPFFKLDEEHAGYEAFLMNLCPPDTYGKRRHRVNMMKEVAKEIELSNKYIKTMKSQNAQFMSLISVIDSTIADKLKQNNIERYLDQFYRMTDEQSGRFSYSPISLLLLFPIIRSFMLQNKRILPECPSINNLSTMKASFDPLSFKNTTALQSISNLVSQSNCPTTPTLAIYLLSQKVRDLTFRMFDKDQIGGDREISIMSSEFRILQSITESFAKSFGSKTGIDMLANPRKVQILTEYQNETTSNLGIRETIDQTRWGPNFNTSIFGYMFLIMLRYNSEAYIPMITCFLSEFKVFQFPFYSELGGYQKEGYTLPGMIGSSHMGQGIYHYTSSLYHSFASSFICKLRSAIANPSLNLVIVSKSLVTSDDACIFNYVVPVHGKTHIQADRDNLNAELRKEIRKYGRLISLFCILTSNYKNIQSETSVEFNSIFLNKDSVGSNSLKFLFSLIDPYTSGNKLRDVRSILDVFTDGINSNLNLKECKTLFYNKLQSTLINWNASSNTVSAVIKLLNTKYNNELFPIECQTVTQSDNVNSLVTSKTILPHKTYEAAASSLEILKKIEPTYEIQSIYELKRETLSKAKQRRLGSNKGIVMSRKMRDECKITLPVEKPVPAIFASASGYISSIFVFKSERALVNPKNTTIVKPAKVINEVEKGFQVVYSKITRGLNISLSELLVSSYEHVPFVNEESKSIDIYLHMNRRYKTVRLIDSEHENLTFAERLTKFDDAIAQTRLSGNASQMIYNKQRRESNTFVFPFPGNIIKYISSVNLPRTNNVLLSQRPVENISYFSGKLQAGNCYSSADFTALPTSMIVESSINFEPNLEDISSAAMHLLISDPYFEQMMNEEMYANLDLVVRHIPKKDSSIYNDVNKSDYSVEVSLGSSTINTESFTQENIDSLITALGKAGIDLNKLAEMGNKESDEMTLPDTDLSFDELFAKVSGVRISHHTVSFKLPAIFKLISQGWFITNSIRSGVLKSLVNAGFVQNLTQTEPSELLYTAITENRSKFQRKPNKTSLIKKDNRNYVCYLSALFPIVDTVDMISSKITSYEGLRSDHEKMSCLLNSAIELGEVDIMLLSTPISGLEYSDNPKGVVLDPFEGLELIERLFIKEEIKSESEEDRELNMDESESNPWDTPVDRWADAE